ncbi:MAG: hypothetical protein K8S13_13910 [Desulfobacula sp.]|uniref:hypothetical protein n=1 Tax=Desulfobacula sp. TaxID=2593537 RepID=UPI0025BD1882|nr:hypothetical protein [Desulfobacula sp.]MCD4720933.1 hypothetical protein [Desulfobacula sp.]
MLQTWPYAWGETLPDTFLPADFPALVGGALVVDSMDEFAPGTYYLGELPVGHYSILITRRAVRDSGDGSTEEYIRVVYFNSDVDVVPCDQVAQLNLNASSYNAYDMVFPCETEKIE